jgi:SAM-dependent methyltransferase
MNGSSDRPWAAELVDVAARSAFRDIRRMVGCHDLGELLDEQAGFYRAVAAEYDDHALPLPGGGELSEALDAFRPTGSVLELACGPGTWTGQLLRHAIDVMAVDASAEMLGIASAGVGKQRVRFVLADLFGWRPDRRYDVVFFGFWLSHVPPERFALFWSLVADCLQPDGRVFFVDDGYRTVEELVEGENSPVVQRGLAVHIRHRVRHRRPAAITVTAIAAGRSSSPAQFCMIKRWRPSHARTLRRTRSDVAVVVPA